MEQAELFKYVVGRLEELGLTYFITGSMATIMYGEPRFTNDIDVVARIDEQHVAALRQAFPLPEFYLSADAIRDAVRFSSQFNIIHPSSGLKIDVMIVGGGEFDRSRLARVVRITAAEDCEAWFASPEDVIIKKLQYFKDGGSDKHIRDIRGVFKVMADELDQGYIQEWARTLGLSEVLKEVLDPGSSGAHRSH